MSYVCQQCKEPLQVTIIQIEIQALLLTSALARRIACRSLTFCIRHDRSFFAFRVTFSCALYGGVRQNGATSILICK